MTTYGEKPAKTKKEQLGTLKEKQQKCVVDTVRVECQEKDVVNKNKTHKTVKEDGI